MSQNVNVLFWNIGSGWKDKIKLNEILSFISPFDAIVIAEPWINHHDLPFISLPEFTLFPSLHPTDPSSPSHSFGGLLLYVKDKFLPFFSIIELNDSTYTDIILCKLFDIHFCFLYIPPITSSSLPLAALPPFDAFVHIVSRFDSLSKYCIMGDLNAHIGCFNFDKRLDIRGCRLLRLIDDFNLALHNGSSISLSQPTFSRANSI